MDFRSLALRTDLLVQRLYGLVEEREGHVLLRTPAVPDFWYGNCLAMPAPPRAGDYGAWMARFERELPGAAHRVFLVDAPGGETGAVKDFEDSGFGIQVSDVLVTEAPRRPEGIAEGFVYRPLEDDADWAAVVDLSQAVNAGGPGADRTYLEGRYGACRRAVALGRGRWWGAWAGDRLAADMGLFWEDGLVRFQSVETHPDFRRRGLCRSLLHAACVRAVQELGAVTFVIVPVDDTVRRIYESVGFTVREKTVDFLRPPCP